MSQRSRPGSAQTLADQQRMSFTAAEALLWGKKTAEEHHHISSRMRGLEEQHQTYHSRIQATEAIAEAAEAATARIRRIEQQVAAIESDEQDRPFDKWVEGEVSTFKVFAEKNKNVRQKQVEIETKISSLEDSVDKAKDVALDLEILLERIARLENDRYKDASLIKKLEGEMVDLKVARQSKAIAGAHMPPPASTERVAPKHMPPPASTERVAPKHMPPPSSTGKVAPKPMRPPPLAQPIAEVEDAADETEDEDALPVHPVMQLKQQTVQAPSSSVTMPKSTSTILSASPQKKGRDEMSARLRVMQRKSINEPKYTFENEPRVGHTSTVHTHPPPRPRPTPLPATQVVERPNLENIVQFDADLPEPPLSHQPAKQLIVKLNIRKRKAEEVAPIPRLTRSQAKKVNDTKHTEFEVPHPKEDAAFVETQLVDEPAAKRRKPNTTRPPPQPRTKAKTAKKPAHATQNDANPVKAVPRKAAAVTKRAKPAGKPLQSSAHVPANPEKKRVSKAKVSTKNAELSTSRFLNPSKSASSKTSVPGYV